MRRREMTIGAAIAIFAGTALWFLPHLIEQKTSSRAATTAFSSTLFPTGTLVFMLLCGLGLIAQAALSFHPPLPPPLDSRAKISVAQTSALSLCYALAMPHLGFLAATIPALLATFVIFGISGWLKGLIYSILTVMLIYLVFVVLLRVPVPFGMFR